MSELTVKRLANGRTMRQLIFALALIAAALAVCWHFQRGIYSRLAGPFISTVEELSELPSLDASYRRLFEISASKPLLLPFRDVTVHTRRGRETGRTYTYFYLLPGGKRPLVLRAAVDNLAFPATGEMIEVPDNVRERIGKVAPKIMEGPGISAVMLDIEDPAFSFHGILAIAAVVAPLIGLGLLIRAALRLMDFRRTPSVAALKVHGAPVDQVVAHIDGELQAGSSATPLYNVHLTPSWLAHTRRANLDLIRLEDLVWVYSTVTTKKLYNLIPYSWSYALHLADRRGKRTAIKASKAKLPELGEAVLQRAPWAFAGFSDEFDAAYRKNRPAVVAAVDDRRQQIITANRTGGNTQPGPA